MKKHVISLIGSLMTLAVYAALVYGFYLLSHGLGWIVAALLVLINASRYTPEARARREVAARILAQREEMKNRISETIATGRVEPTNIRRRGVN